jgi:hypothetical protein
VDHPGRGSDDRIQQTQGVGSSLPGPSRACSRVAAGLVTVALLAYACVGPFDSRDDKPPDESPLDPVRAACEMPERWLTRLERGFDPAHSQDITTVPLTPNFYAGFPSGGFTGTSHSGVWDYLQDVPLVLYGPGFIRPQGEIYLDRPVSLIDMAPTMAELFGEPFAENRPGRALTEALLPADERPVPPRLIVNVVWDGGGWNVLNRWPNRWPFFKKLISAGTSVAEATVGSSPSVTPAVHATIGTGTFPGRHGIVDVHMRVDDSIGASWPGGSPRHLSARTFADIYDKRTSGLAKIGMVAFRTWHLGMIGHGAFLEGGDRDVAVMFRKNGDLYTVPRWYSLPRYLADVKGWRKDAQLVDAADGRIDTQWRGEAVLARFDRLIDSPAWPLYQTRLIGALIRGERYGSDDVPDLLYTNYKQIDLLGHRYNMINEEIGDTIHYSDVALRRLVKTLNHHVGRNRWVLTLTADHGQQPDALAVGAWPIGTDELTSDLAAHFEVDESVVLRWRPSGLWLDSEQIEEVGATMNEVARYLMEYTIEDNLSDPDQLPERFEDRLNERIFETVLTRSQWKEASRCVP